MIKLLAFSFALVIGIMCCAGIASAHAVLLRVTPPTNQTLGQAPTEVDLLFSESLDSQFSAVGVFDASGTRVDNGDGRVDDNNDHLLVATLEPELPNGVYEVSWRNVSAIDVHPDDGYYYLYVGVPVGGATAPTTSALQSTGTPETAVGRWWFYVAASLFGGVLATWKVVLGPTLKEKEAARASVARVARWLVLFGGVLLIVGTLFSALAQAAAAANVPLWSALGQPVADLLLRGRFAAIWWPRLALEIASLVLVAIGGLDGLASECALATLPAVLLTSALTSHGAALPIGGVGITIDWFHIVGATAWVGGLVALAASQGVLRTSQMTKAVLARFGRYALIASMAVLVSGVLQGALEVGSWSALQTTLYGQLLLVKLALLVAMLALAGFNQVRGPGFGLRAELVLGVIVFGVAALLSGTAPTPSV